MFDAWHRVFVQVSDNLRNDTKEDNYENDGDEDEENDDIYTFNRFFNLSDYETFSNDHTTKSVDKVVAFGYYGYSD